MSDILNLSASLNETAETKSFEPSLCVSVRASDGACNYKMGVSGVTAAQLDD